MQISQPKFKNHPVITNLSNITITETILITFSINATPEQTTLINLNLWQGEVLKIFSVL